jgi:hypothetical protein
VVRAPNDERQTSPALVITRDFCVVFHSVESDCLVWDNTTSSVVHCLDHGESKSIICTRPLIDLMTCNVDERPQVVAVSIHADVRDLPC